LHRVETHVDMSPSNQRMKTSHIPQTLMSVPFLQHPALATGRRRHLCSIANVYSTEHMRQQMKRHYLNVLHTYIQSSVYTSHLKGRLQPLSSSSGTAYSVKQTETKSCVFHLRREKEHPRV
uniref:Uncharacterized protein n=1 Tax=Labrus bergylta TaxID=56723 RepID=A0A3Q3E411_9LABR